MQVVINILFKGEGWVPFTFVGSEPPELTQDEESENLLIQGYDSDGEEYQVKVDTREVVAMETVTISGDEE